MRLFVDEDFGRGIPEALRALQMGEGVQYVRRAFRRGIKHGKFPDGVKDEHWIPFAGRGGWLVLSSDTGILDADTQRELWISENVGVVFLTTGQENRVKVMQLLLRKWDWFETVDKKQRRPFAYLMPISGRGIHLDPRVTPPA